MVQKIIHCFWAKGHKTPLAEKCLASWHRFASDWEIREWTLDNLHIDSEFFHGAVEAGAWAAASDYVRMYVLHEFGGVYFDFDVELVQPISALPEGEWVASEYIAGGGVWMNPGGGIALEKGSPIARGMLDCYSRIAFDPHRSMMNWINDSLNIAGEITVLPPEVLSPIDPVGRLHRTDRTVGIHWYAMSWASPHRRLMKWLSWHGMRPLVDLMLKIRRVLTGRAV